MTQKQPIIKLHFFLLLCLNLLFIDKAKSQGLNIDSLWGVFHDEQKTDSVRCEAINNIVWYGYLFSQPDSAFFYSQMQYDFAEKQGQKKYMANALNNQGISFAIRGDNTAAIEYFRKTLKIQEEIGDKQGKANSLNNIGNIYDSQGDYDEAIDHFTQSMEIRKEIGDLRGIAQSLNNIGLIYKGQGDVAKAISCYTLSLKIREKEGDQQGVAACLNNIGLIYYSQADYSRAQEYYKKSLKIKQEIGDRMGEGNTLNNIGLSNWMQRNYPEALNYFEQGLTIRKEMEDKKGIGSSLNNIGNVYLDMKEYTKALKNYQAALEMREEIGDKQGIAASLNCIGRVLYEQGKDKEALQYSNKSLAITQEIGVITETNEAAELLWKVNKNLGNYKASLDMHELYVSTRDSIRSDENQKEVIRQEYQYEYDKQHLSDSLNFLQKQEIERLAHEADLKKEANERYLLYGGLGFLLLLGGVVFRGYQRKKKDNILITKQKYEVERQKELVEEKNQEITDSITYAKRIQEAILPPTRVVKEWLPDSFVLYKPKDIVAGDFYWLESTNGHTIFAAADCTGHGVPGAMVSVVCHNAMNRAVREFGLTDPGKILDKTRELVVETFEASDEEVKDGMDIALCSLKDKTLRYAGANNPVWLIRNGEVIETKATKQAIGKVDSPTPFESHEIELQEGDSFYIFSDGFVDQFGGEKGKKYKAKALRELLLSVQSHPMDEQRRLIDEAFERWRGDLEQVDDVCVIGVRI